ncbi:hypothetical protein OHB54_45165 [Streptomyces sp. NBC_01007]|nr:hypothetical protein OHB54_45165 [Streptomyces sp. NBC_01007]
MGRREVPVDPAAGPVQRFAHELRKLRRESPELTYRMMAQRTPYSASVLSEAAAGERLPTLPVVKAYVQACGGDVAQWQERWQQAAAEERSAAREDKNAAPAPYRGLARYEPTDAEMFFGRDRLTADLLRLARDRRVCAVIGPSGSGKSSLLRAGLVPRLRDAESSGAGSRPAVVRILAPGPHPLRAHAERLVAAHGGDGDTWVIVDQFEELYTLCGDPAERAEFTDRLLAAAGPGGRLRVVLGVRADFLGRCAEHGALATALRQATLLVGPMSPAELRQAVTRPAAARGVLVERALTTRVVEEVAGEPGGLPLLSHALAETWRWRRGRTLAVEAYQAAGGLQGAIAQTAEEVYTGLQPHHRELARLVLLRLITPGEGFADTRRPVDRTELGFAPADEVTLVLDRLARARLLVLDDNKVDLVHEALVTSWPRLHAWVGESREQLRVHRRLTEAAHAWQDLARDPGALYRGTRLTTADELCAEQALTPLEQAFVTASRTARTRESYRRRTLLTAFAALLGLALVAGATAWQQNRTGTAQRTQATARRVAALADSLRYTDPVTAMRLSVAAWRIADTIETRSAVFGALAQKEQDTFTPSGDEDSQYFLTPDTRTLVATGGDHVVRWDVGTHRRTGTFEGLGEERATEVTDIGPDGRHLLLVGADSVRVWDIAAGRYTGAAVHLDASASAEFGPSGRTLDLTGASGDVNHVQIWDWQRHRLLFRRDGRRVQGALVSPDDRLAAVCETGRPLQVWDIARHRAVPMPGAVRGDGSVAGGCAVASFSPDSQRIVAAGPEGGLRLWNVGPHEPGAPESGAPEFYDIPSSFGDDSEEASSGLVDMAFSSDGRFVATADGQEVRLWRLSAKASGPVFRYPLPTGDASRLGRFGLDPDGRTVRYIVQAGEDTAKGTLVRAVSAHDAADPGWHNEPTEHALFSPDGRTLATTWRSGRVSRFRLTDARTGRDRADLPGTACPADPDEPGDGPQDCGELMAFSSDGTTFAYTASTGEFSHSTQRVTVWDLRARRIRASVDVGRPTHSRGVINALALSPDGRTLLASRLRDNDVATETWDISHRGRTGSLPRAGGDAMALRPDGRLLATSYGQLGDLPSRHVVGRRLAQDSVTALSFSAEGRYLAVGDESGRVTLWDGRAPTHRLAVLAGTFTDVRQESGAAVSALAFSLDSHTLAVGGADGTLNLWDVPSGRRLGSALPTAGEPLLAVAFDADGTTLRTSGRYVPLHSYPTDLSTIGARTCRRTGGGLTHAQWKEYIPELPYRDICS